MWGFKQQGVSEKNLNNRKKDRKKRTQKGEDCQTKGPCSTATRGPEKTSKKNKRRPKNEEKGRKGKSLMCD